MNEQEAKIKGEVDNPEMFLLPLLIDVPVLLF